MWRISPVRLSIQSFLCLTKTVNVWQTDSMNVDKRKKEKSSRGPSKFLAARKRHPAFLCTTICCLSHNTKKKPVDQCVLILIKITAGLEVIFLLVFSVCGWDLNLSRYAFWFDVFMNKFIHPLSVPVSFLSASLCLIQIMALNYYNIFDNINSVSVITFVLWVTGVGDISWLTLAQWPPEELCFVVFLE